MVIRLTVPDARTNLFLDSNVWLSFYHFSKDDLEQLRKLEVLIKKRRLRLFVCEQVEHEVRRNRDAKVADAIKRFTERRMAADFPRMCQDYPEYEELRDAVRTYDQAKARLLERLGDDARASSLAADKMIASLFNAGERVPTSPVIVEKARLRMDLGNPPGKNRSLGDAVNWESLLAVAPDQDLVFVTADGDYLSELANDEFSSYLQREWAIQKGGAKVLFFPRLSAFFRANFPSIEFAAELDRDLLVKELAESSSFARTRRALRELEPIAKELNAEQVNAIVEATCANNQIYWIIGDSPIRRRLQALVHDRRAEIDPANLARFDQLLNA